jgi:hypothetical protein
MEPMDRALRAAHSRPEPRTTVAPRRGLVVGAAGGLGSALLERALGGGFASVQALVTLPMSAALRSFEALPFDGSFERPLAHGIDTAWIVFDRARHVNGREDAFYRPQPDVLPALARWLYEGGVRRLIVVLPHTPGLLPQALRRGLASLDEQAVSALGFEHVVFVRSAQHTAEPADPGWPHRIARLMLAQLRWMIPQREQPLRAASVASFAVQVALALDGAEPGTRIVAPELLWQAAQTDDAVALVRRWLLEAPR